jgi:hypothetical protein
MRAKAEALAYLEATAKASATATTNTGVLHCVQDDECCGDASEVLRSFAVLRMKGLLEW